MKGKSATETDYIVVTIREVIEKAIALKSKILLYFSAFNAFAGIGANSLDRQISAEEDRTGVKDAGHFAYSTFAKAAGQRRMNLKASIEGLAAKLDAAVRERDAAQADLAAAAIPDPRELDRGRRRMDRPSTATMR